MLLRIHLLDYALHDYGMANMSSCGDYDAELTAVFTNFTINNSHGAACKMRSKISIGRLNSPAESILSFSHTCGSGKKGARPSVKQAIIKRGKEMSSNQLIVFSLVVGIVCFYFRNQGFIKP